MGGKKEQGGDSNPKNFLGLRGRRKGQKENKSWDNEGKTPRDQAWGKKTKDSQRLLGVQTVQKWEKTHCCVQEGPLKITRRKLVQGGERAQPSKNMKCRE